MTGTWGGKAATRSSSSSQSLSEVFEDEDEDEDEDEEDKTLRDARLTESLRRIHALFLLGVPASGGLVENSRLTA